MCMDNDCHEGEWVRRGGSCVVKTEWISKALSSCVEKLTPIPWKAECRVHCRVSFVDQLPLKFYFIAENLKLPIFTHTPWKSKDCCYAHTHMPCIVVTATCTHTLTHTHTHTLPHTLIHTHTHTLHRSVCTPTVCLRCYQLTKWPVFSSHRVVSRVRGYRTTRSPLLLYGSRDKWWCREICSQSYSYAHQRKARVMSHG